MHAETEPQSPDEDVKLIKTRFTELVGVDHPVVLGGMGTGTTPHLVGTVSEAGGLGILGATSLLALRITTAAEAIRRQTDRPFGMNFLLAFVEEDRFAAALAARPAVLSFAWPRRSRSSPSACTHWSCQTPLSSDDLHQREGCRSGKSLGLSNRRGVLVPN
jgi:NAD(P)H-dependent flavin oxidoreductase YrpB (nitropropane dioxygenase family)